MGKIDMKIIVTAMVGVVMLCHHANCKMPLMPFFHICDPIADKKTAVVECSKGLAPRTYTYLKNGAGQTPRTVTVMFLIRLAPCPLGNLQLFCRFKSSILGLE